MRQYYNYQYYLLNNMKKLELNATQVTLLLFLRYYNETGISPNLNVIGDNLNLEMMAVGNLIEELIEKKYISIQSYHGNIQYDTNVIYKIEEKKEQSKVASIFKKFETGFKRMISQQELNKINDLLQNYDSKLVEYALREALIHDARKVEYVEKVLINWKKKNITVEDYENGNT